MIIRIARLGFLAALLLCLPVVALAGNRFFASGETGHQFHAARSFSKYHQTLEFFGGASLGGRLSGTLGVIRARGRNEFLGSLEVAPLRLGNFAAEVGMARRWRDNGRTDWNLLTLRFFQRVSLGRGILLVPAATLTHNPAWDHDNESGDLELDLILPRGVRAGVAWNVNEDFRNHPLTVRVGLVRVLG